jgi:hypothetical protein
MDVKMKHMDKTTMEFMVWVVGIVAAKYFDRDKTAAYRAMNRSGLWDIGTLGTVRFRPDFFQRVVAETLIFRKN